MHTTMRILFSTLATISIVSATPVLQIREDDSHAYIAPGEGDTRGPCPGLNILANHGYINRNGKNISADSATQAQMTVFNFDHAVAYGPIPSILPTSTTGYADTFNLEDLAAKANDHDGKLSRGDLYFGDNITFNQTIWDSVTAYWPDANVSWKQAAEAGSARLAAAKSANPEYNLTAAGVSATFSQMGGVLAGFGGSVKDGGARKDWINICFAEERLPLAEGWSTPGSVLTADSFAPMITALKGYAPGGV